MDLNMLESHFLSRILFSELRPILSSKKLRVALKWATAGKIDRIEPDHMIAGSVRHDGADSGIEIAVSHITTLSAL